MSASSSPEFTLLIVDNNPNRLDQWCSAARKVGGFSLVTAQALDDGLDALDNYCVDVLVTDLFLTEASEKSNDPSSAEGLTLIDKCRSLHPRSWIVAITMIESVAIGALASAVQAGANEHITQYKHIDPEALLELDLRVFHSVLSKTAAGVPV